MPPQVNARVTAVHAQGIPDDWDTHQGGDPGAPKWVGELAAYYRVKVDRVAADGGVNIITRRTLWVDTAALRRAGLIGNADPELDLDTDDVITFTPAARPELRLPAIAVAASELAGAGPVSTTRIDLEHG